MSTNWLQCSLMSIAKQKDLLCEFLKKIYLANRMHVFLVFCFPEDEWVKVMSTIMTVSNYNTHVLYNSNSLKCGIHFFSFISPQ